VEIAFYWRVTQIPLMHFHSAVAIHLSTDIMLKFGLINLRIGVVIMQYYTYTADLSIYGMGFLVIDNIVSASNYLKILTLLAIYTL